MEPVINPYDQFTTEIIDALLSSKSVLIWAILGTLSGFLISASILVFAFKAMCRRNWPNLKPTLILPVRFGAIFVGLIILIPACSWTGLVVGTGVGAVITINRGDIIEPSTVAALSPLAPSIYAQLAGETESTVAQGVPITKLRTGVDKLTEAAVIEIRKVVSQKVTESNIPGIAGHLAELVLNWFANAKLKEFTTCATDVFDHLENQQITSPNSNQISAAIGTVHLKPIISNYIFRLVKLYSLFALIPAIGVCALPFIIVNLQIRFGSSDKDNKANARH